MKIFVGSTNPVKINAVTIAASEQWPEVNVRGLAVESGISDQPQSDDETKTGAINRAQAALELGLETEPESQVNPSSANFRILGVGLEGGVMLDNQDQMWSVVWVAVIDRQDNLFCSSGARFQVPQIVAEKIMQGREMGPVMSRLFKGRNIKQQEGMIGVITQNFLDRTEEYSAITKMALGLWYGRNWEDNIPE